MIEFIFRHPISIPLTKIHDPPVPLRLLHTTFERMWLEDDVLEKINSGNRIILVYEKSFPATLMMRENPRGFKVSEPTTEEFQSFLNDIRYAGEFMAKKLKKISNLCIMDSSHAPNPLRSLRKAWRYKHNEQRLALRRLHLLLHRIKWCRHHKSLVVGLSELLCQQKTSKNLNSKVLGTHDSTSLQGLERAHSSQHSFERGISYF